MCPTVPRLTCKLGPAPAGCFCQLTEQIIATTRHFTEHRFDFLGSGWVRVFHNMRSRRIEGYLYVMGDSVLLDSEGNWLACWINRANLSQAQKIWKLVDLDYSYID